MKTIFYNTVLLLFLLAGFHGKAQDTKLYSFSLKSTGQYITCSQGSLTMAGAQTAANKLAQLFIVKRLSGGNALILSAADPGLLLKRNGSGLVLAAYIDNDSDFEWDLRYSGYPYLSIAAPGANSILSWQSGSGFIMITGPTALSDNNDTSGDHYRFELSNVTNTF